jgi:sulfatase modifying factor 1
MGRPVARAIRWWQLIGAGTACAFGCIGGEYTKLDQSPNETGGSSASGGTGGTGGNVGGAGAAGAANAGYENQCAVEGRSCSHMTGTECNEESCCTCLIVPGGTFLMGRGTETCEGCSDGCPSSMACNDDEQPEHPMTVSSFALDKYEVTVGRFRAFLDAYDDGWRPSEGEGAHPLIEDSGWDSAWDDQLPAEGYEESPGDDSLEDRVTCAGDYATWQPADEIGENETDAITCVSWFESFAFCIWDGGRLPTEAEWEYAAAGGDENRLFPWGDEVHMPRSYACEEVSGGPRLAVGSYPEGNGRWGHSDLAGSAIEWTLDWYSFEYYSDVQDGCADCANLTVATQRVARNGICDTSATGVRSSRREPYGPGVHYASPGFRCARSAE